MIAVKKGMQISLKPGERIFINGAVIKVDRKVSLELLNDVSFLLESHVLQAENATTPLRQLYFIAQTMLMDPANTEATYGVFKSTHGLLMAAFENEHILDGLESAGNSIAAGRIFDALKTIRGMFRVEDDILAGNKEAHRRGNERREVA
jgi:flagellar protein FlbT